MGAAILSTLSQAQLVHADHPICHNTLLRTIALANFDTA
jgi:hypothetical protein